MMQYRLRAGDLPSRALPVGLLSIALLAAWTPAASAVTVVFDFTGTVSAVDDDGTLAGAGIVDGSPVSGNVTWDPFSPDDVSLPAFPNAASFYDYDGDVPFSMSITVGSTTFASLANDPGGEGAVGTNDLAEYQAFQLSSTFSSRAVCPLGCLIMGVSARDDMLPFELIDGKTPLQIPDFAAAEWINGEVTSLGAGWELYFSVNDFSLTVVPEPGAAALVGLALPAVGAARRALRRGGSGRGRPPAA